MYHSSKLKQCSYILLFVSIIFFGSSADAHVSLLLPSGGESIQVGSVYKVQWQIIVQHQTLNWDLYYSNSGSLGPWIPIALDIPVGDPSGGSIHNFNWTVPDDVTNTARVRIVQDNIMGNYQGISLTDFAIISTTGDFDSDGISNGIDNCPTVPNPTQADSDSDGFGDACDICPGFDDTIDSDSDGVPDGCDICAGFDDAVDTDSDGVPNGCDICIGFDDTIDSDSDGVPDGCDICAGFDDTLDNDFDLVPNGCDNCIDDFNPSQDDEDNNMVGDICEPGCCTGNVGDANLSGEAVGNVTVGDIAAIVEYLFGMGTPLPCFEEADANQSATVMPTGADISVGDIATIVDHLFGSGLQLPACL